MTNDKGEKKDKTSREEFIKEKLAEIYESKMKELDAAFNTAVKSIADIFRKFSVYDIACSMFVSHIWLPNIASSIKHQFLFAIFTSLTPDEFFNENKITTYNDFADFLQEIYPLLPSFVFLEDYIPETDWGEIKFFHNRALYKMFYGQELSNVYDYLMLFQMLHVSLDKEYRSVSGRSPADELDYCLHLQDDIITGITTQPRPEVLSKISPGHIEIPPQDFWENAIEVYNRYDPIKYFPTSFLDNYSIQLGSFPEEHLKSEVFQDMVFRGKVILSFFIQHDERYLPVLPRRYSSILFDSWSIISENNYEKLTNNGMTHSMRMGGELHRYIKARINSSFLRLLVSAVKPNNSPHEVIFSTVFISKDRLILIYVTNPAYTKEKTEAELNKITPKLNEAIGFISTSPVSLSLYLERMNVQFQSNENEELKPELYIVIPQVSTELFSISIPEALSGKVIFMDQFLGIVDELENADTLASFIEYTEEYGHLIKTSFVGPLDVFGSFKSFYGVLVEGALDYDSISLDPHWGSRMRYETLSKFWELYPEKHFFDHPRSWKVIKKTNSRIRLEARGYFGSALYCQVNSTHMFINSPFDEMSYEQGQLANILMECFEDSVSRHKALIDDHQFFHNYDQFQVLFFPFSLVISNDTFKHLRHLDPNGRYWCSDYGLMDAYTYGIRIVFDDKSLAEAFIATKDRSIEIDLLLEVLNQLNEIVPDSNMVSIRSNLELQKSGKPRFKMLAIKKRASFPQFINPYKPAIGHFKRAKKKIAELSKSSGLLEGCYTLEDAKTKLNTLRDNIVKEINTEVEKYDFKKVIPYLLTRIDALTDKYERETLTIEHSLEHEVDYKREEDYAKQHSKYVTMHKNYRYLVEKFVQLQPHGEKNLDKEQFQNLIALIDWLHVFYNASDSLHYDIGTVGMKVDRHFLVDVEYEDDYKIKERVFGKEDAMLKLGLIGNPEDKVSSSRSTEDLLNEMDKAFKQDFGFTFRGMINVLQAMTHWADLKLGIDINPFYAATLNEIEEICVKNIEKIEREEIKRILSFLTLKKNDVLCLIGQDKPCYDLPVWEHRKRFARYNLRPLILIDGKYYWGAYSTRKSGIIWSGNLSYGTLPIDLQNMTIKNVLESEKKLIEKELEKKTFEILNRYTPFANSNVKLHRIDKNAHPPDLGDYDVLAFYPEKNVVINVECKDILPAFCLKDAKTLRETIFGEEEKDEGHFKQINKRKKYLSENLVQIATKLGWPIDTRILPQIITVYLTRLTYWWTRFPPKEVDATFVKVEMLSKLIENL